MQNLFETVAERQLSRLMRAALALARRNAEPAESAAETLAMAATMTHEVLDTRRMRQQCRLAAVLMQD